MMESVMIIPPSDFPVPVVRAAKLVRAALQHEKGLVDISVLETSNGNIYEIGRILKEAIYGQICHAVKLNPSTTRNVFTRSFPYQHMAVKIFFKQRIRQYNGRTQENPMNELGTMQYLGDHPNILGQIECCQDHEYIYSVLPYFDRGELYEFVEEKGALGESMTRSFFIQIVLGLKHLQSHGVAHRDMSLENVLWESSGSCSIIDFGMALRVPVSVKSLPPPSMENVYDFSSSIDEEEQLFAEAELCTNDSKDSVIYKFNPLGICGKKNYISPEVMENNAPFDPLKVDIWALGIMLFIMLTGVPLVEVATPSDQRYCLVRAGLIGNLLEQWKISLSSDAVHLLNGILKPLPSDRLTVDEILAHPWCQSEATNG